MKLTLHIDTSQAKITKVALLTGDLVVRELEATKVQAQVVLPLVEQLLSEGKKTFSNIGAITVATGPGSYTGLRVGLAVATTLSVLLGVPINGQPPGSTLGILYDTDDKFAMMDE